MVSGLKIVVLKTYYNMISNKNNWSYALRVGALWRSNSLSFTCLKVVLLQLLLIGWFPIDGFSQSSEKSLASFQLSAPIAGLVHTEYHAGFTGEVVVEIDISRKLLEIHIQDFDLSRCHWEVEKKPQPNGEVLFEIQLINDGGDAVVLIDVY